MLLRKNIRVILGVDKDVIKQIIEIKAIDLQRYSSQQKIIKYRQLLNYLVYSAYT